MTGTEIQDGLMDAARRLGYLVLHIREARRTEPGWPDLLIVGYGIALAVECKSRNEKLRPRSETQKGRELPGQLDWLHALEAVPGVSAMVCQDRAVGLSKAWSPEGTYWLAGYEWLLSLLQDKAGL
jgi:hypothetical protein